RGTFLGCELGYCGHLVLEVLYGGAAAMHVQLLDEDGHDQVGEPDDGREEDHRDEHDLGHPDELVACRPRDLAQLEVDLTEVVAAPLRLGRCGRTPRTTTRWLGCGRLGLGHVCPPTS